MIPSSIVRWPERTSFNAHMKQCYDYEQVHVKDEHWQLDHCITLTDRYLVLNLLIVDCCQFWWALFTKCLFQSVYSRAFYCLLLCCIDACLVTCFTVLCFTETGGTIRNKFLAVFKATNCTMQLQSTSSTVPHAIGPCITALRPLTTIPPICEKVTTYTSHRKANCPETSQAWTRHTHIHMHA